MSHLPFNTASPDQRSTARRFLPYLLAFILTVCGATAVIYVRGFSNPYPPDALIVETNGHKAEAMAALTGAGIPTLKISDTSGVRIAPFTSQLLGNTRYFAPVFAGFFLVLSLSKRLLR